MPNRPGGTLKNLLSRHDRLAAITTPFTADDSIVAWAGVDCEKVPAPALAADQAL